MESVSERWTRCKKLLRHRLSEEDAATWLPPLELASLSSRKAVLCGIPNSFFRNRINLRFGPLVRECLAEAFGDTVELEGDLRLELQVGGTVQGKETTLAAEGPEAATAGATGAREPPREEKAGGEPGSSNLFLQKCIAGPANALALRLAGEIAAEPGGRYNPFYLVGGVGLGKTHLLRTIAAEVSRSRPAMAVVYRTAEAFANEVLDGIRRKRMAAVRETYRGADLLLLDDVPFLQVSVRSQQELLHTFDALHGAGKQLVFSGHCFPGELTEMDPTLRSRLEMGLVAELGAPDAAMRLALAHAKAREHGLELPPESAELLAEKITSGFRQVEGALMRVAAYASLHGERVTPDFVARVAEPFFEEVPEPAGIPVTGETVLGEVCDHFGLTMKALRSRGRTAHLAKARRVAVYLLREAGGLSFPEIGAALGNRTHSTIVHALHTVEGEMEAEPFFRKAVLRMLRGLKEGNHTVRRAG